MKKKMIEFELPCFATLQALRHLRQISQEVSQPSVTGWGRRPAALRALSQRMSKFVPLLCFAIRLLIYIYNLTSYCNLTSFFTGDSMKLSMALQMMDGLC
jgi:hypothetical protein